MNDIVFVSETEVGPELKLAQGEISHHGFVLTAPVRFEKATNFLKASSIDIVLINAYDKKLEALDLCREIKEAFRGSIKVYVYLPGSNSNEGSRFGLLNAEVEDQNTIANIVNKLTPKQHREYILDENITALYSMNGGVGSSFITTLMSYVLHFHGENSLLLESSNNFTIRENLNLRTGLALLSRDRTREINQARDHDWFSGFLCHSEIIGRMSYLNLFSNLHERAQYLEEAARFANHLAKQVEAGEKLSNLPNSLKLLSKEIDGDSFSLFDEIIQLGSRFSKNMFFDLSSDILSPLNKQLLRFSKHIVLVFRDGHGMKREYLSQKALLEERYSSNIVPVIAPGYFHYSKYKNLSNDDWMDILGDVPLIYPYAPDTVTRFIYDKEAVKPSDELFVFAKDLLFRTGHSLEAEPLSTTKGILKFLNI